MIAYLLITAGIGGVLAYLVADARKIPNPAAYLFLGALLPLIGVIVAAVTKPAAPAGMVKVKCPRCDATTNVQNDAPGMECWQCHLVQGQPA